MNEHQSVAKWLIEQFPNLQIKFLEGGNAPIALKWLQDIESGALEVGPPPSSGLDKEEEDPPGD